MQDKALQRAGGGGGAPGGTSPVTQEDEELLNEEDMPQMQVISDMKNLTMCSPSNPTSSQPETKLWIPRYQDYWYLLLRYQT